MKTKKIVHCDAIIQARTGRTTTTGYFTGKPPRQCFNSGKYRKYRGRKAYCGIHAEKYLGPIGSSENMVKI